MPELPEIALTQKYVEATALHKKITNLHFPETSLLQAPEKEFRTALEGGTFEQTKQLGKYLFIKTDKGMWLVFHFGMTGKLEYYKNQEPPKYTKMLMDFEDASHLAFVCRRKLGKIYLSRGIEEFQEEHSLGKDALDFEKEAFLELLKAKKGSVKAALTDQHSISGIGNVYADEMLYQCSIHPKSKVEKLTKEDRTNLFDQMGNVLRTAIQNDGTRSQLPSNFLTPHRKQGAECPKCSGKIEMIKVSGRSTYFCPSCQKERS